MKKILIITYYWPPAGGPGVQRILKFVKYLRDFGWQPILVTPKDGTYPSRDESLEADIPEDVEVIKTATFEPFAIYNALMGKKNKKEMSIGLIGLNDKSWKTRVTNFIRANYFIPDARKGWNKYAYKAAKAIIENEKIEAVLTSGPPQSTHLIGLKLKNKFKLPWVADFRDPWTNVFYNHFFPRTNSTIKKDYSLESKVLTTSDGILTATQGIADEFSDRQSRYEIIHNGFDENDIKSYSKTKSEKFTLVYTGNFKPNQDLPTLWKVLEELQKESKINDSNFALKFIGKMDPGVKQTLQQSPISTLVAFGEYVPHQEAVLQMQQASMLLFVVPNEKNNALIITGKLFEYLASLTPLLSIGPKKGNADQILNNVGRDAIIDYDDFERLKSAIEHHIDHWVSNDSISFQHEMDEGLKRYSRKELTGKLATMLNQLTGTNG